MQAAEELAKRRHTIATSRLKLSKKTIKRMEHMKPMNKPSTWKAGDTALFVSNEEDDSRHSFWLAEIVSFDSYTKPQYVNINWLEAAVDYGRYHLCKTGRGRDALWRDRIHINTVIGVFNLNVNKSIPEPVAK